MVVRLLKTVYPAVQLPPLCRPFITLDNLTELHKTWARRSDSVGQRRPSKVIAPLSTATESTDTGGEICWFHGALAKRLDGEREGSCCCCGGGCCCCATSGGRRRSEMESGGKDHLCGDWSPGPTAQCWLSFNPPLLPPQRSRETGEPRESTASLCIHGHSGRLKTGLFFENI